MAWRRWVRAVHRDLGYAAVALILAYALSGLAVNHIEDWNPSYTYGERAVAIGPVPGATFAEREAAVVAALKLDVARVRGHFAETETTLRVFLQDGEEVVVDTTTGAGKHKTIERRAGFYQVNVLHLNELKGAWTWVADVFAIALIVLAGTGLVMLDGARGLAGRGKWFLGAGLIPPAIAIGYLLS